MRKLAPAAVAIALALVTTAPALRAQTSLTTTTSVIPTQLRPHSNAPITLHTTDDARAIYQAIGKAAGITVLFDRDYSSKQAQVDLNATNLSDSLRIVGQLTGTFYQVLTPDTIYVAADTHTKHIDLDQLDTQTFYLKNAFTQSDSNEVVQAIRNILPPESKVILIPSDSAIVIRTTPENLLLAQKLINDLDLPKKSYRVTFTVTEVDGNKPVGVQHFAMVVVDGQNSKLKQGSKFPITTGTFGDHASGAALQTQVTYLDIGMTFDITLTGTGSASVLKSDIVQSSLAPEVSGFGPQDPIVRQTELVGESVLTPGKPLMLGSIDIPGSTRRLDVEVIMEPIH